MQSVKAVTVQAHTRKYKKFSHLMGTFEVLGRPIVTVANIIQTVVGYEEYTRKICPRIKPSTVHSIDVDAVAMYEMMARSMVEENFTILDQDNMPISSVQWAIENKLATLCAFLNVKEISRISSDRSTVFENRITYNPDPTVDILR